MEDDLLKILLIESQPEFTRKIEEMLKEAKGATFELVSFDNFEDGLTCLMGGF